MKRIPGVRLLVAFLLLLSALLVMAACQTPDDPQAGSSAPDTIETVSSGEVESSEFAVKFPDAEEFDYSKYVTASRIQEVLGSSKTVAIAADGAKYYDSGVLKQCESGLVTKKSNGTVTLKPDLLGPLFGLGSADLKGTTPEAIAAELGMGVVVYDGKLVLFYDGEAPIHVYDDLYTCEAMYLYMTEAADIDIVNAFIDLPSRVSNGANNTIFYTAPDLNLGLQTSIYFAQLGQANGLDVGPALVAGEGKHPDNHTTVRVYNNQQTCITQFLAFDASVTGGVQVIAAQVGQDTLIATAPFAAHDGASGDVRVFDTFGMLRMIVTVHSILPGPHTIATGHFAEGVEDEVLLIASQTTDEKGELHYVLISLSDGSLISEHTLNCSFAQTEENKSVPVSLSVRNSGAADTVILYFNSIQEVYEGNAQKATFDNAGIDLPEDAVGVSASNVEGQRYTVSLPAREGEKDLSYLTVYSEDASAIQQDVGFRENRFFFFLPYHYYFNDDRYVSRGDFMHIRTDMSNSVMEQLGNVKNSTAVDRIFESATYEDYTYTDTENYINSLQRYYLFLEPCFTHRWNKTASTRILNRYKDPVTGIQKFVSVGMNGEYKDYVEIGGEFYVGTYADGILELAKLRIYPLRSFLQETASAFRGEGANPEHLIGMSPVHEHEIDVAGSVGDYNPYMIEGFRGYMLDRYNSVENINRIFGTSFADRAAIDPPRQNGRGDWDKYEGAYFEEWAMYNRYIVSKRIMEAYREALLAGYPPESISAHQIPEGEAVAGFLGEANTRLTPIDVVLTCGTAYGGTRYGNLESHTNIVVNAHLMGHSNISLGEYCSLHENSTDAYNQLKNLWSNGLRMVYFITFNEAQKNAELEAAYRLIADNEPRPGYTGGTTNSITVNQNGKKYNIVQIGAGADSDSTGLLKSIDTEGKWEGTVYLVPFHTKIVPTAITALNSPVEGTQNQFSTGMLNTIKNSDQAEITFTAYKKSSARAWVEISVYHKDCLISESTTVYELNNAVTVYRYVLANQLYESGLEIRITFHTEAGDGSMDSIVVENLYGTLQFEQAAFTYYDGQEAYKKNEAHKGGVTFDLLDRNMVG